MAKLKNIIKQLSENDYRAIYQSLADSNAEKSAFLLKAMRERSMTDKQIMETLDVNTNAYYTLRSRLNQKIEEYLLQQMESPRTDLLKKVANIHEMVFTKKKAISIATLKKLEKELLDYDLSNELTVVYRVLKKLHLNSTEFFTYSQLYNKHISYMLAIDKIEDILADYFKKFSRFALTGDETDKMSLSLLHQEINELCKLYSSHRPYVYQSCVNIFHRLFIEEDKISPSDDEEDAIEDIFHKIDAIFDQYKMDAIYFHFSLVFEFLKLEYYTHYKVYRKASKYFEGVNENASSLLTFSNLYTYPSQFFETKINRQIQIGNEIELSEENESLFEDYQPDHDDLPNYINYVIYRAVSDYYADKYEESARRINNLLNETSLKSYTYATLEIKAILALQYCALRDYDLFNQLANSIQRQIRILGKDKADDIILFLKMLKTGMSDAKRNKKEKVRLLADKYQSSQRERIFSPCRLVKLDDKFLNIVCANDIDD